MFVCLSFVFYCCLFYCRLVVSLARPAAAAAHTLEREGEGVLEKERERERVCVETFYVYIFEICL